MALKALIFGLDHVILKNGTLGEEINNDLVTMFEYLRSIDVTPIVLGNRNWVTIDDESEETYDIHESLRERFGDLNIYITSADGIRPKPTKDCISHVLGNEKLAHNEVIYVGNSIIDFQTAINSKILFLNAIWETQQIDYGFTIESPLELIEYVKTYGLKQHYWFFEIDRPSSFRSLSPFSTYKEEYQMYSAVARKSAKSGGAARNFFLQSLISSLYLTDYIGVAII